MHADSFGVGPQYRDELLFDEHNALKYGMKPREIDKKKISLSLFLSHRFYPRGSYKLLRARARPTGFFEKNLCVRIFFGRVKVAHENIGIELLLAVYMCIYIYGVYL